MSNPLSGTGILFQVEDPLWKLVSDEERNPMKSRWAPNEATPDYVASYNIEDFIGYGFICCYECLAPENFTMWNMVQRNDVKWLRAYFLDILEQLILSWYEGDIEIGSKDFDHSDWGESLNIGNSDDGDEEEFMITIAPYCVHEDAMAMGFDYSLLVGEGTGGEDEVIWLAFEALKDRQYVYDTIEKARTINGLVDRAWASDRSKERWAAVIAAQSEDDE